MIPRKRNKKRGKKKAWETIIKRQNQTDQHPEQPEKQGSPQTGPDSTTGVSFECSWSNLPRGLAPPCLGNARSEGDAKREKCRGRKIKFQWAWLYIARVVFQKFQVRLNCDSMVINVICVKLSLCATLSSPPALPPAYNAYPATPNIISCLRIFRRSPQKNEILKDKHGD